MTSGFFLEIALKSVAILALGLVLVALLRHRSAADRVFMLRLTVFLLLALPLTAAFGPTLEVEQPQALSGLARAPAPLVSQMLAPSGEAPLPAVATGEAAPFDGAFLLLVVYGLGVGAVLSHLAGGLWTLRRWTRAARPVVHPLWDAAQERAAYRTGVKRRVYVLQSADASAPLSWGLRRPAILLDRQTVRRDEEAEAVLAHEFAHISRADWPMLILSRLMLALFWFNPLAWLLDRRLAEQSEEAADMAAVRRLDPGAYAQALLSAVAHPAMRALPATPMAGNSGLGRRIHRVLDAGARNRLSGSGWTVLAGCGAFAATAAIAMLQIVPAAVLAETAAPAVAVAEPLAPAAPAAGPAPTPALVPGVRSRAEEPRPATGSAPGAEPRPAALAEAPAEPAAPVAPLAPPAPPPPPAMAEPPSPPLSVRQSALAAQAVARREAQAAAQEARAIAAERRAEREGTREARVQEEDQAEDAELRAMGLTRVYMAAMASALRLERISTDDLAALKAMNISPDMVRGMVAAGYARISVDELQELAAMAVTPAYVRGLAAAGFRGLSVDELVGLKAVGVTADFAGEARRKGLATCAEELIELRTSGRA